MNAAPKTGAEAVQALRDAMALAGLPRTSRYAGGEMTGWTEAMGATGFSILPLKDGTLLWHVVLSGKPHLEYRDLDGRDGYEPVDPERLIPRVRAVFESLDLDVKEVRISGYANGWDDDVCYGAITAHPVWLEKAPFTPGF